MSTPTLTANYSVGDATTDHTFRVSGSFTPGANSTLFVTCFALENAASIPAMDLTITANTGGLTFTRLIQSTEVDASLNGIVAVWSAPVGGSPSSMTVTIDMGAGDPYGWYAIGAFSAVATGTVGVKSGQIITAGESYTPGPNHTHTSGTLPGAATSGNTSVFIVGTYDDDVTGVTGPSGGGFSQTLFAVTTPHTKIAAFASSTFTGTSTSSPDLGDYVTVAASILMELEDDSPEPGDPAVVITLHKAI